MHDDLPSHFHTRRRRTPLSGRSARVKFKFRVDFVNGGHVEGEDFLLDIEGTDVSAARLAEMIVSALNLLRAGPVTIYGMEVVRRGDHDDL